ncbi:DUF2092 domain-containing protein [Methylomonas sp. MO1]|uniref:DUF2092 domain-containing protein n=1 Tax=Methylomonas sp. MO1 TaxID=3073619 RepID=UPI0028A4FAE0|nr:DUF2092 domain-containing protein [Methylomonas sp. MO1]MDT4290355.1 DUF2092 domain-containing protein [Methylomonas sp. MO1]
MYKTLQPGIRNALCVAILSILAGCAEQQTVSHPQAAISHQSLPQAGPEATDAKGILQRMANYLAKTPAFAVNLNDSYDTVQASGEKIEFSATRQVVVSRPNGLRVEREGSDGVKQMVLYDGKDITIFSPSDNVYAQTAKPGGIDEAVKYFLKDLNMRLPLAVLLVSELPAELERRTQSLEYVEKTTIHGQAAHHLAARTETVDYQVWIAEGPKPLPLRVVLTYKLEEGQPQFRAQFSDWNLAPQIDNTQFAFTPAEGAKKIAFLAQVPSIVPGASENPAHSGEK